jgi:hypothetical protein
VSARRAVLDCLSSVAAVQAAVDAE